MRLRLLSGHRPRKILAALLLVLSLTSLGSLDLPADAKKKKSTVDPQAEAKLKEGLEPLSKSLNDLLIKTQSRYLFSPQESGQLADIKFKLMELMKDHPKNVLLVQPIYQAGVLYQKREQYDDAFELFSFLVNSFPENPYGLRAQGEIQAMKRVLGSNYFPERSIFELQQEKVEKAGEEKKTESSAPEDKKK